VLLFPIPGSMGLVGAPMAAGEHYDGDLRLIDGCRRCACRKPLPQQQISEVLA